MTGSQLEYGVFSILDGGIPEADRNAVRDACVVACETAVSEETGSGDLLLRNAQALLALAPDAPAPLFSAWAGAIQTACPDRKAMRMACNEFARRVTPLPARSRDLFLRGIVLLARCANDSTCTQIASGLRALCDSPADPAAIATRLDFLQKYLPLLPDEAWTGIWTIAVGEDATAKDGLLERIAAVCPVDKVQDEDDAFDFLCKAAALVKAAPDAIGPAMDLCLAAMNSSSASGALVAGKLPAILRGLNGEARKAYPVAAVAIVASAGPGAIGFCLKELPGLAGSSTPVRLGEFTTTVAEIATAFGRRAALEFIDGGTAAARNFLTR